MEVTIAQIADLISSTRAKFPKMSWTEAGIQRQNHVILPQWVKNKKDLVDGGTKVEFDVRLKNAGVAKNVALHEQNPVSIIDTMSKGSVPWRHTQVFYAFERREFLINKGSATKLYSLIKNRRDGSRIDMANRMEIDGWSKPADSSDEKQVFGVDYWVTSGATPGSFCGAAASGFTDKGGITPQAGWYNWYDTFASVTHEDLGEKLRLAMEYTNFTSPLDAEEAALSRRGAYMPTVIKVRLEGLMRDSNDQVGFDLGTGRGGTTLNGNPLRRVAELDGRSNLPVFLLNHESFGVKVLDGDNMFEHEPMILDQRPNTIVNYVDLTWAIICDNVREQALIAYVP